ncbi:MAG: Mpo1-like protein [Ferrimicrobium sp.]|jgi:hypothetical protein|uniref:Mpo1-like protein n=1 Tax=Ferrimicrobium acidiphilum TaxID=121039 RepID=A0ABV3Y454_9ACTN|nr:MULTISPECIES: DUF962 domain-containing protein [Ferrimicrobium]MCL5973118.1 DUF962 domain-containing protein [Actinomycetota bacterium]
MSDEFWLRYLRAHSLRTTRTLHYLGSTLALGALLRASRPRDLWFVALAGYLPAWFAHLVFEHNRPETFSHPAASLLADYRMLSLAATGRLCPHLKRALSDLHAGE